jgi:hypothetical protein
VPIVLRTRTKVLLALSALAPASVLIVRLDTEAVVRQAKVDGGWGVWVEPGGLIYTFFFIGCVSFVLAIVSTIVDVSRSDS